MGEPLIFRPGAAAVAFGVAAAVLPAQHQRQQPLSLVGIGRARGRRGHAVGQRS